MAVTSLTKMDSDIEKWLSEAINAEEFVTTQSLNALKEGNRLRPGVPFSQAEKIAQLCFCKFHTYDFLGGNNARFWKRPIQPKSDMWPYVDNFRLSFGVFRTKDSYGNHHDERYGLTVRMQSPYEVKDWIVRQIRAIFIRIFAQIDMPVSFMRTRPIQVVQQPVMTWPFAVGLAGFGHDVSRGALTAFVQHANRPGGDVYGLTAAHIFDRPGYKSSVGQPVCCPPTAQFDPNALEQSCGKIVEIHRLNVDSMSIRNLLDVDVKRTLDTAIFSIENGPLNDLKRSALRRIELHGRPQELRAPIDPRQLFNGDKDREHPIVFKLKSMTDEMEMRIIALGVNADVSIPGIGARVLAGAIEMVSSKGRPKIGDSGSLIVGGHGEAVAMLVAVEDRFRIVDGLPSTVSYAIPLTSIFDAMSLELA